MRERVNPPVQEGIERARERVANMMIPAVRRISQCIPHDQEEEATTWHDMEVRQHERAARKLNRSMRGKVNAPTQGGSKRARVSAANMILPDDWEEDAMTWHEKEEREHQRAERSQAEAWEEELMHQPEKENEREQGKHDIARQLRGRSNGLVWEGSKRARESSKEVEQKCKRKELTHWPEKEAREQERSWQAWHCQMIEWKKQWTNMRRKWESTREQQRSQTEAQEEESIHWHNKEVKEWERECRKHDVARQLEEEAKKQWTNVRRRWGSVQDWQKSHTEAWEEDWTHQCEKEGREQVREWQTQYCQWWEELFNVLPTMVRKKQWPNVRRKWESVREWQTHHC